jgi:SnoaL-like domain
MTSAPSPVPAAVAAWHAVVDAHDPKLLDAILADEIVFRSPAVHTPQEGRARASAYLNAALVVLTPTLRYVREWYGAGSAVLEFEATLDQWTVHGVDIITWNAEDRLTDFTVMMRPLKGLQQVITLMGNELARGQIQP